MNFNQINDRKDLANYIGVKPSFLTYHLYHNPKIKRNQHYTEFEISKKSGGTRIIAAPNKKLKIIQKKLAYQLNEYLISLGFYRNNKNIHAFIKENKANKRGIISNSKIHRNKKYVVNIDLLNFFESIHFGRVKGYFQSDDKFNLSKDIATIIAQICTYKGSLPQGAPTSPIISNLIGSILDSKILKLTKKYKLHFTRYADDITFSTNDHKFLENFEVFNKELSRIIESAGFKINTSKTRLQFRKSRQQVTGLVVNEKLNIPRDYYKKTRAMANNLYKNDEFEIDGKIASRNQLEGRFSFINQLEWYNNKKIKNKKNSYRCLSGKEKEYQRFIFYNYFIKSESLVLITEGKTDSLYIKAALKKYWKKYPKFIIKNDDGKFSFKIIFLNKTKRLNYFFGINKDGADSLIYLYNHYKGINGANNLAEYFKKFNCKYSNPIIMLFDNEINDKGKPLKKIYNHVKFNKEELHNNLYVNLINNLYIATTPLIGSRNHSEIEDLFPKETLDEGIKGRPFTKDENYNRKKNCGKDEFSKYIYNNYNEINFENFIPLLDALYKI
ncbi:retron Ec67 family RNA-directed DNA polymerase/endonuclease [Staphylococcus caeli]|uniref:retron Ec67 family RNA-directed DNA polymerase/endonuclease n=1 Tax=Staphylococcus caeli TaxID=2201815 RepID=UPI003F5637A5